MEVLTSPSPGWFSVSRALSSLQGNDREMDRLLRMNSEGGALLPMSSKINSKLVMKRRGEKNANTELLARVSSSPPANDREADNLLRMYSEGGALLPMSSKTNRSVMKRRGEKNADTDLLAGVVPQEGWMEGELSGDKNMESESDTLDDVGIQLSLRPSKTPLTPRRLNFARSLSSRAMNGGGGDYGVTFDGKHTQFQTVTEREVPVNATYLNESKPPKDKLSKWKSMSANVRGEKQQSPRADSTLYNDSWSSK